MSKETAEQLSFKVNQLKDPDICGRIGIVQSVQFPPGGYTRGESMCCTVCSRVISVAPDMMLLLLFHKQQTPTSGSAVLLFVRWLSNALVDEMKMLLDHATTASIMMMLINNTDITGRTADANTVTVWFMNRRKRDRKSVSCVSGANPLTSKVEILQ